MEDRDGEAEEKKCEREVTRRKTKWQQGGG